MPNEWSAFFEQHGEISSFVEAVKVAIGTELHSKEAEPVTDQDIEKTMEELRNQDITGRYGASMGAVIEIAPSFHGHTVSILHDNIGKCVKKKIDLPVRKVNTKELYREATWETVQDQPVTSSPPPGQILPR